MNPLFFIKKQPQKGVPAALFVTAFPFFVPENAIFVPERPILSPCGNVGNSAAFLSAVCATFAVREQNKKRKNMISTFGDSIMRGVISETKKGDGKPKYKISQNNFVSRCEQNLGVRILNFSCFGSTTTQGMRYVDRYGEELKGSNVAVFEYGGNDCDFDWKAVAEAPQAQHQPNVTLHRFVQQYDMLIGRVKKMGIAPIILSMPVIEPDRFFETVSIGLNRNNILQWLGGKTIRISHWHERYNLELFKFARQKKVPIVDITSPFLELPDYGDYLCADGIHPNERGHALIAEVLMAKAAHYPGLQQCG